MFFLFESPLKKKNEGFEKKKLQERIPVVFHLHNLLDSVTKGISYFANDSNPPFRA